MTHDEFVDQFEDMIEEEVEHAALDEAFLCCDCGVSTLENNEYYMVQFIIWQTVVPKEWQRGMLCIGCLEKLVGRELTPADFTECPLNYYSQKSERLESRMGDWFKLLDVRDDPQAAHVSVMEAIGEFRNRMGWDED